MTLRRVTVELALDVSRYTNRLPVAQRETRQLSAALEDLADEAGRATSALDDLDERVRRLGRVPDSVDDLAEQAEQAATALDRAGDEADTAGRQVRGLGRDADRAADDVRELAWALRQVEGLSLADAMGGAGDGRMPAPGSSAGFGGAGGAGLGMTRSLQPLATSPMVLGSAAAAAAAMSPLIGAAIGAAVIGGAGTGGIVGGIIAARSDPRVQSAWGRLSERIDRDMEQAARPFATALVDAADIADEAWERNAGHIESISTKLAPVVTKLTSGAGLALDEVLSGVDDMADESAALLSALAAEIPEVGRAIKDALGNIARGGPGAIRALLTLLRIVELTIRATGIWIGTMAQVYDWVSKVMDKLGPLVVLTGTLGTIMADSEGKASEFVDQIGQTPPALRDMGEAAAQAAMDLDKLRRAETDLMDIQDGLLGQAINVEQALDDLGETLADNGNKWDIGTQAGRDNMSALMEVARAAREARQSQIDQGYSIGYANAQYATQIARLEALMIKMGATRGQIDALIGRWRLPVPPMDLKIRVTTYGSLPASVGLRQIAGGHYAMAEGGVVGAAQGTIVSRPTVLFGEGQARFEGFVPSSGISQDRAHGLLSTMAGWHGMAVTPPGGGQMTMAVSMAGGTGLDRVLGAWLHEAIRSGRVRLSAGGQTVRVAGA